VELIEEPMAQQSAPACRWRKPPARWWWTSGGGTTEVGVISLGGIVYSGSVRSEATSSTRRSSITSRRNYGMLIGETTAEEIKKEIGSAFPGSEVREKEVKGPTSRKASRAASPFPANEILEALTDPLNSIVSAVKSALEQTPPELGADIAEKGMVLTRRRRAVCATSTVC